MVRRSVPAHNQQVAYRAENFETPADAVTFENAKTSSTSPLLTRLIEEKSSNSGIYHKLQAEFTYNLITLRERFP